ncbi:MAG: sulfatase [Verrucomicrobiales bacterium]
MKRFLMTSLVVGTLSPLLASDGEATQPERPNVLFIAVDDLNDWIGCMGGNPQSVTPNFDRLAASGMLFTNAHCVAPACNPSRTAVMTGRSPHRTGVYSNRQSMRDVLPDEPIISAYFAEHGYWAGGSGKMLHYFTDADSWDEYFPAKETESPIPETLYPEKRPVSLEVAGPWQYIETDWGPLDTTNEEFGGDYTVSEWVGEKLSKKHDEPFFLACGIYRPHEPWFVPQAYFDKFPLDSIELPPAYKEGDLEDLPAMGKRIGPNRYFEHILSQGQWKQGIQGYLASIHFADDMLGRVLDALEEGPNADRTIVVLWSDHGWHLGSKQHWQKYTAWRACTRVPMMVRVPKNLSAKLPEGTKEGVICDQPVSLISLFPTLTDLCGLPAKDTFDGRSIVPLLANPSEVLDPVAITYLDTVGSIGVSGKDWRYIRYSDGTEELYDIKNDPYEWDNLAPKGSSEAKLKEFRAHIPKTFAPKPKVKVKDLPSLKWNAFQEGVEVPRSVEDGGRMRLAFVNESGVKVNVERVTTQGEKVDEDVIEAGATLETTSAPGAAWIVRSAEGEAMGYFIHGDRGARAVIPNEGK